MRLCGNKKARHLIPYFDEMAQGAKNLDDVREKIEQRMDSGKAYYRLMKWALLSPRKAGTARRILNHLMAKDGLEDRVDHADIIKLARSVKTARFNMDRVWVLLRQYQMNQEEKHQSLKPKTT